MGLDDYQVKVLKQTAKHLVDEPRSSVMVQMPTGSGKTEIGIALLWLHQKRYGTKAQAWLTHREELRSQSSSRLSKAGLAVSFMGQYQPSARKWKAGFVNVFGPQLRSLPLELENPGLLIVDEAHHSPASSWGSVIRTWKEQGGAVVGLTATPWRMSKKQGFEAWFDYMVKGPSMRWLQENNYLATPRVVSAPTALLDRSGAKVLSTGDFAWDWMEESVIKMLEHEMVIPHWHEFTESMSDKRTMWFTPTVDCAKALASALGAKSRVLLGETDTPDRHVYLDELRAGKIDHLVSVDVLGEGLDIPSVPIVASLRPTKSLVVWLQQCGRASRAKGARGKEGGEYYVLDYANNASEHGVPDVDRDWSLKPRSRFGSSLPFEIQCSCYDCKTVTLHPSNRECWNCGARQYKPCTACHVDKRWTQFKSGTSVCDACTKARKEKEALKQGKIDPNRRSQYNHKQRMRRRREAPRYRVQLNIKDY